MNDPKIIINEWAHIQARAGEHRDAGLDEVSIYQALKSWVADNRTDTPDEKLRELAKEVTGEYSEPLPYALLVKTIEYGIRRTLNCPKTYRALLKSSGARRYQLGRQVFDQVFNAMRTNGEIISLGHCSSKGREMFALDPNARPVIEELLACAQDALARGWAILTCEPRDKSPWAKYSPYAVNSATRDPKIALKPWDDCEEANYGVACGASNITVLCTELGLSSIEEFEAWRQEHNLPETYTVISGSDQFSAHMYYSGAVPTTGFDIGGVTGELKSHGGYVVGAGSVHPSGKKYSIYKDIPIAPLPDVFKSVFKCIKPQPQPVYSQDGDVIGYIENGNFVPFVLDIADAYVQKYVRYQYWHGMFVDNQVVWSNPNISKFLEGHGLTLEKILPFVGSCDFKGHCGTCGKQGLSFSASSRTALMETVKNVLEKNNGICSECWEKKQAAKAEADKIAQQQALTEKEQELSAYRQSLILKYGKDLVTDIRCECGKGFLVVKIGSAQVPFLGCSTFNYFRSSSCKYTSSISPESIAELLPIFQKRLEATAKGVAA